MQGPFHIGVRRYDPVRGLRCCTAAPSSESGEVIIFQAVAKFFEQKSAAKKEKNMLWCLLRVKTEFIPSSKIIMGGVSRAKIILN